MGIFSLYSRITLTFFFLSFSESFFLFSLFSFFFSLLSHTSTTLIEKLLLFLSLEYFYQLMNSFLLLPSLHFFTHFKLLLLLSLSPSFFLIILSLFSLSRVSFIHRSLFPTCILLLPHHQHLRSFIIIIHLNPDQRRNRSTAHLLPKLNHFLIRKNHFFGLLAIDFFSLFSLFSLSLYSRIYISLYISLFLSPEKVEEKRYHVLNFGIERWRNPLLEREKRAEKRQRKAEKKSRREFVSDES